MVKLDYVQVNWKNHLNFLPYFPKGVVITTEESKLSVFNTTFTSLSYANGPGGLTEIRKTNISNKETRKNLKY